jgi:putative transcriptional regulator
VKTFVETTDFSRWQPRFLPGDVYAELQKPRRNKSRDYEVEAEALAERLKAGLTEAVQSAKGELTLRTVQVPAPPPEIAGKEVTSLRTKSGMSQAVFARVLNVSTKTVQSWEQGERKPSHAALRMLQVFRENPVFVIEIVGIPAKVGGQTARRIKSSPLPR